MVNEHEGLISLSKSILSNDRVCFVCKTPYGLHRHHIYPGSRRQKSEEMGAWVYLCGYHHNLSGCGVHNNKTLNIRLKQMAQRKLEETMTREEFIREFGRSYLE